jgi:hypothetical protein
VEPSKPLSFLDAHLRCGDALLGVYDLGALNIGIPDEAYKPLTGDVKAAASEWRKRNKAERDTRKQGEFSLFEPPREVLEAARALEAEDEEALAEVEAKAEHFRALLAGPDRYRMEVACDLYVAAFLLPKTLPPPRHTGDPGAFIPTSRDVWDKLAGRPPHGLLEGQAVSAAKAARAFHWPLEFPQVFFPGAKRQSAFDLALGNPPWEVNQLSEEEYFASRAPEIAKLSGKARKDAIKALEKDDSRLWTMYQFDKHAFDATNEFFRAVDRFKLTAVGKINTYSLFAELFATIGRWAGLIVPTGIATDATTAQFFASLMSDRRIRSLFDFRNTGFFPGAASAQGVRFCLMALTQTAHVATNFCFRLTAISQLKDAERHYSLTPAEIAIINPNTLTAPIFRSKADAELTKQIYARMPVLIDDTAGKNGNPWGIEFRQGLFNMTSDSGLFRTSKQLSAEGLTRAGRGWARVDGTRRYVPLYEAKMIHHYDHRYGDYALTTIKEDTDTRQIPQAAIETLNDPAYDVTPRYWVPEAEVASRLAAKRWTRGWLMGWRDITSGLDERTVIASAIPRSGVGDKFLLMFPNVDEPRLAALVATLSSLAFDFVARQKLGGTSLKCES